MKIKEETKKQIINDYNTGHYSYATLAAKYGVSGTSIGRIVNPEYQERERKKNKLRQKNYKHPKAKYSVNLRFSEQDQPLINKIKSVDNIQAYIKELILEDISENE